MAKYVALLKSVSRVGFPYKSGRCSSQMLEKADDEGSKKALAELEGEC